MRHVEQRIDAGTFQRLGIEWSGSHTQHIRVASSQWCKLPPVASRALHMHMRDACLISQRARSLLRSAVVWDNHACMPLRPGDTRFLAQLERVRTSGVHVVSLNVSFDLA